MLPEEVNVSWNQLLWRLLAMCGTMKYALLVVKAKNDDIFQQTQHG